jgi:hypothetical protein
MAQLSGAVLGAMNLQGTDAYGVVWLFEDVKGWGAPGGTLSPLQKPRQAGLWAGASYAKGRPLVLTGTAIAPNEYTASVALDRLIGAASLDDTVLTVSESGRQRWQTVRRDGDVLPTWAGATAFSYSIQVVAPDPRKFGIALTASTKLPSTSGGLTVPFTVPFGIPAVTVSGQVNLTNPGNETGPVTIRIDGPCAGPIVTHVGSASALVFSASLILSAGEWLDIDLEKRSVLANGQASRNGYITSRGWFGFEPGANTFAFTAKTFNTASQMTVTAIAADK